MAAAACKASEVAQAASAAAAGFVPARVRICAVASAAVPTCLPPCLARGWWFYLLICHGSSYRAGSAVRVLPRQ
jgi:hypothetical protein